MSFLDLNISLFQTIQATNVNFKFRHIPFQGNFNPRVYDKRDEFSFLFVNFPFWNVSLVPSYGVYVSQLVFYIYL